MSERSQDVTKIYKIQITSGDPEGVFCFGKVSHTEDKNTMVYDDI